MLTGRRYLLALTPEQEAFAERTAGICRAVWNIALEQRREYRRRGAWINYKEQWPQLIEAKVDFPWLKEAPAHCLIKTFRWTRPLGGTIKNATVRRDGGRWYISFLVEDGVAKVEPSGKPAVGVDRGVAVAVATSDGWMRDREFATAGEAERLKRLQQALARSRRVHGANRGSKRRDATRARLGRLHARIRCRRQDFAAWTANRLTRDHGLVAVEHLKVANMTRSSRGTSERPGRNVRQKAGLNRAILNKGWGGLVLALEHKARYTGSQIVKVPPAYTSQRCSQCGHVDPKSRQSQADFRCTACGYRDNADVNAAKNILAAGLAVTGRGDPGNGRSAKRQPNIAYGVAVGGGQPVEETP